MTTREKTQAGAQHSSHTYAPACLTPIPKESCGESQWHPTELAHTYSKQHRFQLSDPLCWPNSALTPTYTHPTPPFSFNPKRHPTLPPSSCPDKPHSSPPTKLRHKTWQ